MFVCFIFCAALISFEPGPLKEFLEAANRGILLKSRLKWNNLFNFSSDNEFYFSSFLIFGLSTGHIRLIEQYINAGNDVNSKDTEGWSLFVTAAKNGKILKFTSK